jgi:uncharacterized protein
LDKKNKHKKRAVVLFTLTPAKESLRKKIINEQSKNSLLLKYLYDNTIKVLQFSKRKIDFDIILSTSHNLNNDEFIYLKQQGDNFDQRLKNTLSGVFEEGYDEIVIVGNDCPELSSELIEHSFNSLASNDVVVGPSTDGGFYLLALKNNDENIFNEVQWYSDKVLSQLLDNIAKLNFTFTLLTKLNDIDNYTDLIEWLINCSSTNLQFYFQLKRLLIVYQLFISIYSIKFSSSESYLKIWQKPPPLN